MVMGIYDPSSVQATSGIIGEYDIHDQKVLKAYHKLVQYLIETEKGSILREMMVELTKEIFK